MPEITQPEITQTQPNAQTHTNAQPTTSQHSVEASAHLPQHCTEASMQMQVKKRDGSLEPVNVNKIVNVVTACATGLKNVDPMRVATKAINGLYNGATTAELDQLCIQTAAMLIVYSPEYSKLAARLLSRYIEEEVSSQGVINFYQSVQIAHKQGLVSRKSFSFVKEHKEALNIIIDPQFTRHLEYFGLKTLCDRYLFKSPHSRKLIENPQYFFLRVACGLAKNFEEAKELYEAIASLNFLPSSPTLFNSGTPRPQMSSCYLLDSPQDSLKSIYDKYTDVALLSKFAGGIGLSFSRVRSRGSFIKGTNGNSNGIIPWLKTLDSSVAAVNQGGRRKGAACVYLESWHADIESFLELRENTGSESQRTHNLNTANWVPDLFMKRVEQDAMWSLFDPKEVPHFVDLFGDEFEKAYEEAEAQGLSVKQVKARDLYGRMMRSLAQTGNGWMTFKDAANNKCNQSLVSGNTVHLSNLCTEILEVTNARESAVCNLASINLSLHLKYKGDKPAFDFAKLARSTRLAVKYLDRVVDANFYPIESAKRSNCKWRPVGLGVMGLQDVFFKLGLPFDAPEAQKLSARIAEDIYYHALSASCDLASQLGAHENFAQTRLSQGQLQFDLWQHVPEDLQKWESLRRRIKERGVRNSLLIAIAPTATIASIAGVYEAIEPQVSNLFKRETLSGEFIQVNRYLVQRLRALNLWDDAMLNKIKRHEGRLEEIKEIPPDIKRLFRTVWDIPQKSLIDMAASRGPFIDQSQSLNLFIASPTISKLSSMYMYAWKRGLKTTYYLRSRPATRIAQVTAGGAAGGVEACSLENPEICDACQ